MTYPTGSAAPDGSGRPMGAPLRVSLNPDLAGGNSAHARAIAQAIAREALATDT